MRHGSTRLRLILITAGLVLSHAGVAWLGRAWPSAGDAGGGASTDVVAAEGGPGMVNWDLSVAGLQERVRQREAEKKAEEEKEWGEGQNWSERVAAARLKIPADADLAALVQKGVAEADARFGEDVSPITPETAAAWGLWLERDVDAALGWLDRRGGADVIHYSELHGEIARWLGTQGPARLAGLLEAHPRSAEELLNAGRELARERGPDFTLAMAKTLTDPAARIGLIRAGLGSAEKITGRIAQVRSLLHSDAELSSFLDDLRRSDRDGSLAEEILAAGFPLHLLTEHQEEIERERVNEEERKARAAAYRQQPKEKRPLAKAMEDLVSEPPSQFASPPDARMPEFLEAVPDFKKWCERVCDGRIPLEEVIARTRQALPEVANMDHDLRILVARGVWWTDPVATLVWLRDSGVDWQNEDVVNFKALDAGQICVLFGGYPDRIELTDERFDEVVSSLDDWYSADPATCLEALKRLPDPALFTRFKQKVDEEAAAEKAKEMEEEEEEDDNE